MVGKTVSNRIEALVSGNHFERLAEATQRGAGSVGITGNSGQTALEICHTPRSDSSPVQAFFNLVGTNSPPLAVIRWTYTSDAYPAALAAGMLYQIETHGTVEAQKEKAA
jgi:hypothetical protein